MVTWTRRALAILICAMATSTALAAEKTFDKHFNAPPGGKLTLDTDVGSVVIVGREAREVVVHADMSGSDDFVTHLDVRAVQGSTGVTVTGREGHSSWFNWFFDIGRRKVLYTIAVPRDYPVDVSTAGGSLDIAHLNASVHGATSGGRVTIRDVRGSIDARTSGGSIDAAELAGPAQLHTSGGSIEVSDSTGDLDVHSSGGGIHLERIDGRVQASTAGGAVEAQLRANRGVSLVTGGGSITLRLPASVQGSVDAHTSGGSTKTEIPLSAIANVSSNDLRGSINGGGAPIFLRTSGGSIYIGPLLD